MTGDENMREKERVRQLKQQLRDELRQELDGYRQVEDEELYERIDKKIIVTKKRTEDGIGSSICIES